MSVEITITSSRALACSGRLVAGETADITVTGGAAASLYLVDNKREVIAVCTTFEQGAGSINLATVPIGDMVFGIPAGRLVTVMALIKDAAGSIIGYGSLPLVSAPMPANLEDIDVDLFIKASDIRALFANLPTVYPSQRTISDTLAQVVTLLKNFGLCLLFAFAAHATEWQDVPANTVIGDGLTLTNGTISAAGGGTDGQAVTNIVEGILADATNGMVKVENGQVLLDDAEISAAGATLGILAVGDLRAGGAAAFYGGDGDEYELAVKGDIPDLGNYTGDIVTGGRISAGAIDVQGTPLGTAAYRDATEFATATDEALIYQLITNRLSGVTFDFSTVAGLYLAISNIVAAQGGTITNFPAIP